jgi:hypothetical protein
MSNLNPIYVTLKEGRHKTQPWTFTIDRPGPQNKETKQERYVSMWSAKRGAARKLVGTGLQWWVDILRDGRFFDVKAGKYRPVKFIIQRLKRK